MESKTSVFSPTVDPAWACKVHVVGIGGSGLRGMVRLLSQRGAQISGSELCDSAVLDRLRRENIECRIGHKETNVTQGVNLVVISAAIDASNPEVKAARNRRIPVLKYAECLGQLMAEKSGIAVAGTHGKTTTTAMTCQVLKSSGLDPSFLIGGDCPALGGGARWGQGPYFVAEACEFDRSFLNLSPQRAIVTNVDEDHLDYFRSFTEIRRAFGEFVSLLPPEGLLVLNRDDSNSTFLRDLTASRVTSYSLEAGMGDWWVEDLTDGPLGHRFFAVHHSGERVEVRLEVPGLHNVRNALATVALCRDLGIELEDIARGLEAFSGVRRRFDILAREPVTVVDDYAHHPTEIQAVVSAARTRLKDRRLVAVFQPHQHSRLKRFSREFVEGLAQFDHVLVLNVYRSRDTEEDARTVQSDRLVGGLGRQGTIAEYTPTFASASARLRSVVREGDGVFFLGAGNVTDLAKSYASEIKSRSQDNPATSILSA